MAPGVMDTDPKIEQMRIELLRQMPPPRKLRLMAQLNHMARSLALSEIRTHYPQASEAELHRRLAERILGSELADKVYGPLPATTK